MPDKARRTLESEVASFLLFVAGTFFSTEAILHYINFFVVSSARNTVSIVLILGSVAIALLYFALAYSCWRNPADAGFFGFAMMLSSILSAAYFILVIVEALGSKLYFASYVSYFEFFSGYGSVTVFVELLIAFFSYRVCRAISDSA